MKAVALAVLRVAADRDPLESWDSEEAPAPSRAAAFLDCDGLGEDHVFWPIFRSALNLEGVLGQTTLELAVRKWSEWESYQDYMVQSGQLAGDILTVPGLTYANGSEVELRINGLIDLPVIFQKAAYSQLFDQPPKWGASEYVGFLSCPVGFVLVQYVIFIANKVRGNLDPSLLKDYWEGMVNAFGLIYAVPSYVLDHSESANWGLTSFDIAVNLNVERSYYRNYEAYCQETPIPPPLLTHWSHDLPSFQSSDWWCAKSTTTSEPLRVALIGEHGPVNLDHLSTTEAVWRNCATDGAEGGPEIEAGHFFTYLWALEGTAQGEELRRSLRMSWEAFWGEPLTKSQGRSESSSAPRWTVAGAVAALKGWAWREPFLRAARIQICCEPLWLCVLMHAAVGSSRLLVRVSMCLLHSFSQIFGEQELPHFWPLVRAMGSEVKAISAAARISAEMLNFQAGIRPPYVPALSLHVEAAAQYRPNSPDVLLFRFRLPGAPGFIRVLQMLSEEAKAQGLPVARIVIMDASKKSLSFQEIGHYRLLALLPHVPYAQRLPDVFALGSPTLVPAQPLLHKFMWPFAGPFCGRSDPDLSRSVDPISGNNSHPYSPFEFQQKIFHPGHFEEDRRYWAQYTEWELWPHLIRFRSAREMLHLATMSQEEAFSISRLMRAHHQVLRKDSLQYWSKALSACQ
ncbi:unnamed protein product [Durusdinium trenchii]|uniref:rRNA biogenesis protein rrp5 n=2 Tax=Durusdinium trenchii TaxID=1381693 RepID=A0ABP0IV66_9DINO